MFRGLVFIYVLCLLVSSCKSDNKSIVSIQEGDKSTYNGWKVEKRISIENVDALGITAYQNMIFVSDSTSNLVLRVLNDTDKVDTILSKNKPTYINQKRGRVMMPLLDNDSVFVYGGRPDFFKFNMPYELNDPTCFDGRSTSQFALVNQGTSEIVVCEEGAYTMEGGFGTEEGKFNNPSSVVLSGGKYYITDTGNKRIQIMSKAGDIIDVFGIDQNMSFPTGITASNDEFIYVCDPVMKEILIFDNAGGYVESIKDIVESPTDMFYQDSILYVAGKGSQTISLLRNKNF